MLMLNENIRITYLVPGLGHHLCSAPAHGPDSNSAAAFFETLQPLAAVYALVLQERAAVVELDAVVPAVLGFLSEALPAFPSERVVVLYVLPAA